MLPVSVGIVGATGLIGSTLLKQIAEQAPNLRNVLRASISVVGVTSSKRMAVSPSVGLHPADFKDALEKVLSSNTARCVCPAGQACMHDAQP